MDVDRPRFKNLTKSPTHLSFFLSQWEGIENKPLFVAYSIGGVVAVWVTATVIGTVDKVPLFPKFFEAIGLAYSSWFTYRYLLFKTGREELIKDVETLKDKITASE